MAEEFRNRYMTIINHGDQMFALTLARDVGIFDSLLEATKPLSVKDIADMKHLKDRYVQEILGSLSSGQIIELETSHDGTPKYFLSEAGKEVFGPGGIKQRTLLFNAVMACYGSVKECVYRDGPSSVRYGDELFYALDEMGKENLDQTISTLLKNSPELEQKLEKGISVAEFGSGTGGLVARMAEKFPNSKFTGSDIRPHLVEQMAALHGHIDNTNFSVLDICALPETIKEKFDFIFCKNVIHDLPLPEEALKGLRRYVQEPDGTVIFMDHCGAGNHQANVGDTEAAAYYSLSTFLCIPESFQRDDSIALGACSSRKQLSDFASQAQFDVTTIELDKHFALFHCKPLTT